MSAHADSTAQPARVRLSVARGVARSLAIALAVAWLAIGGIGAFLYVHRYWLYRGFPPPVTPPGVANGAPMRVTFFSRSLGTTAHYLVYRPAGYDRMVAAGRRLPVMYILHGHPGWAGNILNAGAAGRDLDVLMDRRRVEPMLLVMPEGPTRDTEWANASAGPWESFVLDVVRDADHRLPTIPDRRHRVIAGLSEGGYGAVNIALHHLDVFGGVESWSGYYIQKGPSGFQDATPALLAANSPVEYLPSLAPRIRRAGLHAFLYDGLSDRKGYKLVGFARELSTAGASVQWAFYPGAHDWALWRGQLSHMLQVANGWFASARAHGHRHRGHAARRAARAAHPIAAPRAALSVSFFSPALGRREGYLVYLPRDYARAVHAGHRFPVMYLLHGYPGDGGQLLRLTDAEGALDALTAQHLVRPMLLVLPQGSPRDTEWANASAGPWESFVLDVVRSVDRRFATIPDRRHRIIAGLSEGGYGALNVALHHLDVFGGVQSWSGYYVQTGPQGFQNAGPLLLAANSPAEYVPGLAPRIRRLGLRVFLYGGLADRRSYKLLGFAREMALGGASVEWAFYPGGHDWPLWRAEFPRMAEIASRWFATPLVNSHRGRRA